MNFATVSVASVSPALATVPSCSGAILGSGQMFMTVTLIEGAEDGGVPSQVMNLVHHGGQSVAVDVLQTLRAERAVLAQRGVAHNRNVALVNREIVGGDSHGQDGGSVVARLCHG